MYRLRCLAAAFYHFTVFVELIVSWSREEGSFVLLGIVLCNIRKNFKFLRIAFRKPNSLSAVHLDWSKMKAFKDITQQSI